MEPEIHRVALGFAEIPFLSIAAVVADQVVKAASVRLLGLETSGNESLMLRIEGDVAAVKAAVDAGAKAVEGLGKLIAAHVIARPHEDLTALLPR